MTPTAALLLTADTYCTAVGISRARLGTLLAHDARFLVRLECGSSCTLRVYERAMAWLSRHWPEGAEWPAGVARPAVHQ